MELPLKIQELIRLKTFAPDEAGVGLDNAMSINLDTTISAGIQSPTDSDWFRFTAKEGETYTLSVVSDSTGSTSGLPIAITELFDSTKNINNCSRRTFY